MSIALDELPDIIIEQVLSILEFSDQVKLRVCNKRISRLLKYLVFEEMPEIYDDYDFIIMAPQIGKYIKRLQYSVNRIFFEVVDKFPKLEHIEVSGDPEVGVFDQLHLLDIKLKSFVLELYEPFPTQPQFNFNHVIKNLTELYLFLWNQDSKRLDVLKMLRIPNLKAFKLTAYYIPEDTLVDINRNFPDLITLSLENKGDQSELELTPSTFLKLKKLSLFLLGIQNCHQFPFQSFPEIKVLEFGNTVFAGERAIKIIKEILFERLLGLSIQMFEISKGDAYNLQNLKYANLVLGKSFDAKSMQHLLSLPKLAQLILSNNISDNIFQNVVCKAPLYSLTLKYNLELSRYFLKFLQSEAPSLTKLIIEPSFGGFASEANKIYKLSGQSNLNLLYLKVYSYEEKFVTWVKALSPNVYITYLDYDD